MLLIISKNKRDRDAFAETFYYMGILAYGVAPQAALGEIGRGFRAALFIGDGLSEYEELVTAMRKYSLSCPVFALGEPDDARYAFFDSVLSWEGYVSELACQIISSQKERGFSALGEYRAGGIDASSNRTSIDYFGREIHLTKTEAMIFRYLISCYPVPQKAANILKYAFRSGRMPQITNIRTHISVINSKFSEAFSSPIIGSETGIGYTILTPEHIKL